MKLLALALAVLAPSLCAQGWVKAEKTDAFTGNSYIQYTLTGRFLTPPREGAQTQPRMILQCFPGEKKYAGKWYLAGRFIKAYVEKERFSTMRKARFRSYIGGTMAKRNPTLGESRPMAPPYLSL